MKETFERYLLDRHKSKASVKAYIRHLNRINKEVFKDKLDINDKNSNITKSQIDDIKTWLEKQVELGIFHRNTLIPYYSSVKHWIRYIGFVKSYEQEEWLSKEYLKSEPFIIDRNKDLTNTLTFCRTIKFVQRNIGIKINSV